MNLPNRRTLASNALTLRKHVMFGRMTCLWLAALATLAGSCGEPTAAPEPAAPATAAPATPRFEPVRSATAQTLVALPAEVVVRTDAVYEAAPPIEAILGTWKVRVGDRVTKGQVLAEMTSPMLADLDAQIDAASRVARAKRRLVKLKKAQQKAGYATAPEVAQAQVGAAETRAQQAALRQGIKARQALGIGGASWSWKSPVAGIVTAVRCVAGSTVGSAPCLKVVDDGATELAVAVPERYLGAIDGVTVNFFGTAGQRLKGLPLRRSASAIAPESRTRTLYFGAAGLLPGSSGRVDVVAAAASDALSIPSSAVTTWEGQEAVFARTDDMATANPVPVQVLGRHEGRTLVRSRQLSTAHRVAATQVFFLKSQRLLGGEDEGDGTGEASKGEQEQP